MGKNEWHKFYFNDVICGKGDFKNERYFKEILRKMCFRWKAHVIASLNCENCVSMPDTDEWEYTDIDYVKKIEKEFPLEDRFIEEFRTMMTMKLNNDITEEAEIIKLRSQVLWDCCIRFIFRMIPSDVKELFYVPAHPLVALYPRVEILLQKYTRKYNRVIIE